MKFPGPGKLSMKFVGEDGEVIEHEVFDAPSSGVYMGMYNLDNRSRISPAHHSTTACRSAGRLYLSTKNTILKQYDGQLHADLPADL